MPFGMRGFEHAEVSDELEKICDDMPSCEVCSGFCLGDYPHVGLSGGMFPIGVEDALLYKTDSDTLERMATVYNAIVGGRKVC